MLSRELSEAMDESAFGRIIKAASGLSFGPGGRGRRPRVKVMKGVGKKGVVVNIDAFDHATEVEVRKRAMAMLQKLGLERDFNVTFDEWPEGMLLWFTPR